MSQAEEGSSKKIGLVKGDFAGWIVDTDEEFAQAVTEFCEKADQNEEILVIADAAHALVNGDSRSTRKRLHIRLGADLLDEQHRIIPDRVCNVIRDTRKAALESGAKGLRVLLDMAWLRSGVPLSDTLVALARTLYRLLLEDGCLVLALYDSRLVAPSVMLEAFTLHARVVLRGEVYDNIYFCPPEDLLRRNRSQALLDHLCSQVEAGKQLKARPVLALDSKGTIRMLEAMIESMGYGLLVVDASGKLILVNRMGEDILGYGLVDLPLVERVRLFGNYLPDMVTPYPLEELPVSKAVRGESVDQAEIFIRNDRRPKGIWVSSTGRPIRDEQGRVVGGVLVLRDISEEKRAKEERTRLEARMYRSQKMESLGLLAGGIAHDFNNLLMGVLGNAALALIEIAEGADLRPRLENIRTSATRLAELTNQLLAYAGKGTFSDEPLDLSALVGEMESLLRTVTSKKARIHCEFAGNLPTIRGDGSQLRQIAMNLITNASDALGDQPGDIYIRTGLMRADREYLDQTFLTDSLEAGNYVYLEVSDTGCGMDQETLSKIFDPFFTTKVKGRGLGLAAVVGIVRRHWGTLKVESRVGIGSSFRVLFPMPKETMAALPAQAKRENGYQGSGTILVVDDEDIVRSIARQMLERSGFCVLDANNGRSALELARDQKNNIIAVLLDMTMPDMGGDQVFQVLRREHPGIKVIISSGYSEGDTRKLFLAERPNAFLQKPYLPQALIEKVRSVIEPDEPRPQVAQRRLVVAR